MHPVRVEPTTPRSLVISQALYHLAIAPLDIALKVDNRFVHGHFYSFNQLLSDFVNTSIKIGYLYFVL